MKFAEIIIAAGGSVKNHPKAAHIRVHLYYRKDRVVIEPVAFTEPLFARNRREQSRFLHYLNSLEKSPLPGNMKVLISEASVILNYKSPNAMVFHRN